MKIISVNTWGGRMMEPFKQFLKKHHDAHIFCFQEVYHEAHGKDKIWLDGSNFNFLNDIKKVLTEYDCYYRPHLDDWWGLAMFVKKDLPIIREGDHFVHKYNGHNRAIEVHGHTAKNVQFIETKYGDKTITVLNFHGLWNGKGKNDTEDRINQSTNIIKFIKTLRTEYIFCGDFNLSPDTESLRMISQELGCRELIREYGINSTRTALYDKPNKFADYMFVSTGLKIIDFQVLPDVISDHAPFWVEI